MSTTSHPVAPPKTEAEKVWQTGFDADVAAALAEITPPAVEAGPDDAALAAKFEAAVAAAEAADLSGQLVPEKPDAPADPVVPPADPAGQASAAVAKPDPAAEAAQVAKPEEKSTTSALLQLMEKEKAFTDERARFRAEVETFERQRETMQDELARQRANMIDAETLKRVLSTQPEALLSAIGLPLDHVSQLLVAAKMGDKAPDEIKRAAMQARERAETYALRDRVNQMEQGKAAAEHAASVRTSAKEWVTTKISETLTPVLATAAKSDPDAVVAEVFDEIVRDAAARMHREPNGKEISFEEAARRVERRVARLVKSSGTAKAEPTSTNVPAQQPAPAAGNPQATKTPGISPSELKAKKPLLPWQDPTRENEVEAALAEAAAYERKIRLGSR